MTYTYTIKLYTYNTYIHPTQTQAKTKNIYNNYIKER